MGLCVVHFFVLLMFKEKQGVGLKERILTGVEGFQGAKGKRVNKRNCRRFYRTFAKLPPTTGVLVMLRRISRHWLILHMSVERSFVCLRHLICTRCSGLKNKR